MRALVFLLVLLPSLSFADRIVLKDGKEYRGTFVSGEKGKVTFRINRGLVRTFSAADIVRLEIGDKPAPDMPRKSPVQQTDRSMPARTPAATPKQTPPPNAPPPAPLTVPEQGVATTTPLDGMGAIDSEYTRMGSDSGALGSPRAPQQPTSDGRASVRFYLKGAIYWTSAAGAHAILGNVFQAWMAQGGEQSRLGYPTTDEQVSNAGFSRQQSFEGGTITWTQKDGATVQYSR